MSPEKAVERYIAERLTTDTYRTVRMLTITRAVGTLFSSMHWTLVTFARPRLATSDHPVVVWPPAWGARHRPIANDLVKTERITAAHPCPI